MMPTTSSAWPCTSPAMIWKLPSANCARRSRLDPRKTEAHFYLGQALRDLVERETLVEAEQAFRTYLDQGAPLGHEEEVQEILKSRRRKQTTE